MEIRERILQAATRLMAEKGYDGTSLAAVATSVGIKKPSLLYHFDSKPRLRKAVLEQLLSRWNDVLPRLLMASAQTGLNKFDAVMQELLSFFADDPDRARLLLREMLDRPGEIEQALRAFGRPWVEVVSEYIRKGQESGQILKSVDPEAYILHVSSLALATVSSVHGTQGLLDNGGELSPLERALGEVARIARTSLFDAGYLAHRQKELGDLD